MSKGADRNGSQFTFSQRVLLTILPLPLSLVIWLLSLTWRYEVIGEDSALTLPYGMVASPSVFCLWHQCILTSCSYFRHSRAVLPVSQSFDGEIITRIMRFFGYGTARGSSSRGAARALLGLKRDAIDQGKGVAFTADGPRGPVHKSKMGPVKLAQLTGTPMRFFHSEAKHAWIGRSWDSFAIPKPFTRIVVSWARELQVPRDASDAELELYRQQVDEALERARHRALERLDRSGD